MSEKKRSRGRPRSAIRKPLQLCIYMSVELHEDLDRMAKLGGRPVHCQIDHMIALARMLIAFCDGNDNLKVVEDKLRKARELLDKEKG